MRQAQHTLTLRTPGSGLVDITGKVAARLRDQRMTNRPPHPVLPAHLPPRC